MTRPEPTPTPPEIARVPECAALSVLDHALYTAGFALLAVNPRVAARTSSHRGWTVERSSPSPSSIKPTSCNAPYAATAMPLPNGRERAMPATRFDATRPAKNALARPSESVRTLSTRGGATGSVASWGGSMGTIRR